MATFLAAISCISDRAGNIFVADPVPLRDPAQSKIRKIDRNGTVSTIFTSSIRLVSLGFNATGDIFFPDYDGGTIRKITSPSTSDGIGNFRHPSAVVSDAYGNLFVTDTEDHCIYWFDAQNNRRNLAGDRSFSGYTDSIGANSRFNRPRMMVFDSKGRLFVVDQNNAAIRMITW